MITTILTPQSIFLVAIKVLKMSTTFCPDVFFLPTTEQPWLLLLLRRYNLTELANDAECYLYGHPDLTSVDVKRSPILTDSIHNNPGKVHITSS